MEEKTKGLTMRKAARLANRAKKMQLQLNFETIMPDGESIDVVPTKAETAIAKAHSSFHSESQELGSTTQPMHDKAIEIKMRSLIDAGADWQDVRELAALWLEVSPTAERAAFCFDICALTGDEPALIAWLERWETLGRENFWLLAQSELRDHVILRLWKINTGKEQLRRILMPLQGQSALSEIETFAIFNLILQSSAKNEVMLFFRQHGQSIMQVLASHAKNFGHRVPAFLLQMGTMAMNIGIVDLARQLLEMVRPDQDEYNDAADLLMKLKYKDGAHGHHFAIKMAKLINWEDKLGYLTELLAKVKDSDVDVMVFRPEINALVQDTFEYLPENESVNSQVATLLGANLGIADSIPNVYLQIYARRSQFLTPDLDRAFWKPISNLEAKDPAVRLLKNIALIRLFLADGLSAETLFWQARPELLGLDPCRFAGNQRFLLQDWRDEVCQQLTQSQYLRSPTKNHVLALLKSLAPDDRVAVYDLESLINVAALDSLVVVDQLIHIASERRSDVFLYKLLMQRAKLSSLRNRDLESLWLLALSMETPDLAWRTATVLQARHVLRLEVAHTRDVCGVDILPVKRPSDKAEAKADFIGDLLPWFDPIDVSLLRFYQHVGPQLPLLVKLQDAKAKLDHSPGGQRSREQTKAMVQIKAKIEKFTGMNPYDKVPVLSQAQNLTEGLQASSQEVPVIYQLLANSFGLTSTGFSLQNLSDLIDDRFPILSGKRYAKVKCTKTEHWFKHLKNEAKSAFTALRGRLGDYPDARCIVLMQKFTLMLTLLISGDHASCLEQAQKMRTKITILRDLERFIVSPEYETFRIKHGRLLNVPIPGSIVRMDRILIQQR